MSGALHDFSRSPEHALPRPRAGEIVALLGSPEARKVALRAFSGLQTEEGAVPTAEIGLLCARPRFFAWLDLTENLAFALPKATPFEREGLIANVLVRLGLAGQAKQRPVELSPEGLLRLAIARLLLVRPRLLLIDEPFAVLEAEARARLAAFLPELCTQARPAVVIATGSVEEALRLADRIHVLPQAGPAAFSLDNLLARPREERSVGFVTLRRELRRALEKETRPAAPEVEAAA
ncbi:ABC-type nitrate/sulfonate/bicarbonate transport system ATPase subunit [Bosea sp. BE271]|uniref:ATP-binding cassette domain-containing protein n=1 Tax=Bosea TaxID=85413 RepID=UPI00285A5F69|nr:MULTISPECIES: ATP-binding cassette domain-containing protein [Bosea]MDR6826385.1 ABC-type nitrate/sulfonate/bicarbonate transport system ATPase subunit [Bosea robiniae]MDR6893095.1 ABC-type nitrate/sulfonate/bicarbonate transport system ATPase subunit [Bosea sp. BE109]MDR7137206.1 ABC-type nitrate/sulfonate/bicarbonate transport system ATPase subunit [Bosea sp. BE168]MDR7173906.1 ABC-type nitrate/sulfonate/bicarbonate transport system ATPase subunit [Bosea sp. BE271]